MGSYRTLPPYRKAFDLAMEIFETSKSFPPEEKFSLTDQIRRSSRSLCTNIVEAYKRKRYKDYYISRLNDPEAENAETQVWLDFSHACQYINKEKRNPLSMKNDEVVKLVLYMINNPQKYR